MANGRASTMRITIVIGPFLPMPPDATGAIEKVWHALAGAFAARGHAVTVVTPRGETTPGDDVREGVSYRRLPRFARTGSTGRDLVKDLVHSWRAARILPDADVTVTNCFWLPFLLRFMPGTRERIGAIDVHCQRFPKGQFRLYRRVERISTVSAAIADAIRDQDPVAGARTVVIPNPVDLATFRPVADGRARGKRILFTGRVHPEKGLEILVRAYRRLREEDPEVSLRLVGPSEIARGGGGEAFVARLRELAGDAPLEFGGNVADPARLADELRAADVYGYPSVAFLGEASPVAPLEAMACGTVPVVSDLPQFREYLQDGETGLVFARGAAEPDRELAAALRRVLGDAALRKRLSAAGVAKAREFSIDAIADRHLADFASIVRR
jgi:glycosyltransferase involved in cell wall biosynthesis